ncbi:MAG: HAD-IA family hydrolase [Pseudomonadales bacterium]|jgi:N-acetyl-D-muramate 6-phosphate phosphatase|nr:HAD-IA family hydrolase [Pseudomonadales bacterium]MBL6804184.1 HAD-IA family hydrolase [Pseudomonadales bacterium]
MTLDTSIECVLFDLDGTLVDTAPDFVIALNLLLAQHGKQALDACVISRTVSDGAKALVSLGFGIDDKAEGFAPLHTDLLALYLKQIETTRSVLYPGMESLLDSLERAGIPWGIVTNKPRLYATALLSRLSLLSRCPVLVCPDDVEEKKPHPESLFLALSTLQCKPERCVYIGDHIRDMQAAKNADLIAIAASYGYLADGVDPAEWPADFILSQPEQSIALLNLLKFR